MRKRLVLELAFLVAAAMVLAGCAGSGAGRGKSAAYEGELREFDLYLKQFSHELYPDAVVDAWGFSDSPETPPTVPGPTIRLREGDTLRVNFHILGAPMAHTLHWHGLHVPWNMDGMPYISQLPIGDRKFDGHGNLFTYEFKVDQSGTYWYHCHVDTAHHVDMGMYGAIIVDPADPEADPSYDAESVLMFDEWDRSHAHQNAAAIESAISKSGDPMVTANDMYAFIRDYLLMNGVYNDTVLGDRYAPTVMGQGGQEIPNPLQNAPGMRETRNWYPITYAPYFAEYDTYLINGKAFPSTEPVFIKMGQTLRIRLINAGEEVHSMHIHGHHFQVTHKDGYLLPAPYYADTVLIGPGERYDLYLKADNPGPWHIHDHISLNEQNDYINPGGMATMLCYEDGWANADMCAEGHKMHMMFKGNFTNVQLIKDQAEFLQALAGGYVGPGGSGTTAVPVPSGVPGASLPTAPTSGASGPLTLPSLPAQHVH